MSRNKHVHIDRDDPEHYAAIKAQQKQLRDIMRRQINGARLCPYCRRILYLFGEGSHGMVTMRCPRCGEEVYLSAITEADTEKARSIYLADGDDLARLRMASDGEAPADS